MKSLKITIPPLRDLSISLSHPGSNEGRAVVEEEIAENCSSPHAPSLRMRKNPGLRISGFFPVEKWSPGERVFVSFPRSSLHLVPDEVRV